MSKLPLITAILPCYNHSRWVVDAITSVATQDYQAKRIVVIDDGSTDGSHLIALSCLENPKVLDPNEQGGEEGGEAPLWVAHGHILGTDTPIMIQRHPSNSGPSFARNWGLKVSWEDTDAFMFLDTDDFYLPQKMTTSVVEWLKDAENIGMVYSDYEIERPSGERYRNWSRSFSRQLLMRENIINPLSLVSKKALNQVGVFDNDLRTCEDYDVWLRIAEQFQIIHIPESLAVKRVGPHDSTSTVSKERWARDLSRVYEKMHLRLRGS